MMDSTGAERLGPSSETAARWPFVVALALLLVGALGFLFAPIAGIVYLAFLGTAIGTYWAFATRSPARGALAAASGMFVLGAFAFVTGAVSLVSEELFIVQELGFGLGLIVFPVTGVAIGFGALVVALARPGTCPYDSSSSSSPEIPDSTLSTTVASQSCWQKPMQSVSVPR